jgi:small subunit ribosomal protein S7
MEKDFFVLTKLLHLLIKKGKKAKALKIFLNVLRKLKEAKLNVPAVEIISQAVENVKPSLHVKKVKKSTKIFYLPKVVSLKQKVNLSLHWIVKSADNRSERKFEDKLAQELLDCYKGTGLTIAKKQALYDTLNQNRPFLHMLRYK